MATDSSKNRYYTNPADIYAVFRTLQADRSTVNVQFGQGNQLFNTLVLNADLRSRTLSLDEITPRAGHELAAKGDPFNLRASINGIRVYVPELRINRILNDASGTFYELSFPERLLYLQRRDAFRVLVPTRLKVTARCRFSDRKPVTAEVQNLSATGVRLVMDGKILPPLAMMEKFSQTLALPPPDGAIEMTLETVYVDYDRPKNQTIMGCRFADLSRNKQIIINRFVTQLQREALI